MAADAEITGWLRAQPQAGHLYHPLGSGDTAETEWKEKLKAEGRRTGHHLLSVTQHDNHGHATTTDTQHLRLLALDLHKSDLIASYG